MSRLALREGNAKKPVYTMHKWWARRLGVVFRMLLLSQSGPRRGAGPSLWTQFYNDSALPDGFTVLDPFLGGGTSLVEAAKLGANCIGLDIDPVACFVTQMELTPAASGVIRARFEEIQASVGEHIRNLYRSQVGGQAVDVIYYFWVDSLTCPDCGTTCDGHPTYQIAHDRARNRQHVVCAACDHICETRLEAKLIRCSGCGEHSDLRRPPVALGKLVCPTCSAQHPIHYLYQNGLAEPRLLAMEYVTPEGNRAFASTSAYDLSLYESAERLLFRHESALVIPATKIPGEGRSDARPLLYGYRRYRDLFNARQLYCLGLIASEIRKIQDSAVRCALALAFSHCLASNNMFCGYAFGYRRLTPLFSVHGYRKISRPVEGNVWGIQFGRGSFANAVRAVVKGGDYMRAPFEYRYPARGEPVRVFVGASKHKDDNASCAPAASVTIINRSSERLCGIRNGSVDLILTDPPYFDNISYSELSDFYHVWLREILGRDYPGHASKHTPIAEALFGGKRGHDSSEAETRRRYISTLNRVLQECYRVTKDCGTLVFTYHHRSPKAWAALGRCLVQSGFRSSEIFPVRSEGQSGLHSYEGTIKWDSVFLCRKLPRSTVLQASKRLCEEVGRSAASKARDWRTRVRRSRLQFSLADESSLAMAFVVDAFSQRNIDPEKLPCALTAALAGCQDPARISPSKTR